MNKNQKIHIGKILPTNLSRIIAAAVCIVIIAAAVIIYIVSLQMDKQSRAYSGEQTNISLVLCFDVEIMGNFKVIETQNHDDGLYSEYLIAEDCVDIRLWRNFTRPKMSCKKQIKEKYPVLKGYSSKRVADDSILSERGKFSVKEEKEKYRHTVVLLRKDGWDYLVDFAVKDKDYKKYEDYIDKLINSLFYL